MSRKIMDILVLDDEPQRHVWFRAKFPTDNLTHVMTYEEAIAELARHKYHVVFLDHDLGIGYQYTGADVTLYLVKELPVDSRPNLVWIHSMNPVGAANMEIILKQAGIPSRRVPFGTF